MRKLKFKFVYNRKNKLNNQGEALIQLRITKAKEQKFISTIMIAGI